MKSLSSKEVVLPPSSSLFSPLPRYLPTYHLFSSSDPLNSSTTTLRHTGVQLQLLSNNHIPPTSRVSQACATAIDYINLGRPYHLLLPLKSQSSFEIRPSHNESARPVRTDKADGACFRLPLPSIPQLATHEFTIFIKDRLSIDYYIESITQVITVASLLLANLLNPSICYKRLISFLSRSDLLIIHHFSIISSQYFTIDFPSFVQHFRFDSLLHRYQHSPSPTSSSSFT